MKERGYVILAAEKVKSQELDIASGSACAQVDLRSPRAWFPKARFAIIRNTTGFMRSLRLRKQIKEHTVRIRPGRENVEYAGFRLVSGR